MVGGRRRAPGPRLRLDDGADAHERAAHRLAADLERAGARRLARPIAGLVEPSTADHVPAPHSVGAALGEAGAPLGSATRSALEPALGTTLSDVRVHTGAAASRSARDVDALAFSVGRDIVFDAGAYAPHTPRGRRLLAHELAHIVQDGSPDVVHRYRRPTSMAFGELDTATLVEQNFDPKTDKATKPWIELVTVQFATTSTDANGSTFWQGTATATYHANASKLADVTFAVVGGSAELGRTDAGSFTVTRIEGLGYNSGSFSGTVDPATREKGTNWKYTKKDPLTGDRPANMSLAVFYNRGEALHVGPLDLSSHGCVHVDWTPMLQVNYHSVIGLTKVKVSYPKVP